MTTKQSDTSWSSTVKKFNKCPHCSKGILDTRVKRNLAVKYIFTWLGTKRYLCNVCGKKSYTKN